MDINDKNDAIVRRMQAMIERVAVLQEHDLYFYNQPIEELHGGARVVVNGREMGMYASYSYLGLVGHPRINQAAQEAISFIQLCDKKIKYLQSLLEDVG